MAQIENSYRKTFAVLPRGNTGLDIRHQILVLLLSSFTIIPMPIAGGIPILIGVTVSIYLVYFAFPSKTVFLDTVDRYYLYLALALFSWEAISLYVHITNRDVLFVLARGLWIAIAVGVIMGMNLLYVRKGLKPITSILCLALGLLLVAMFIEMKFFPRYSTGRNFGAFAVPFPSATGVPNSDGKLGTFLSICLCYFLFLRPPMAKWQAVLLCLGPIVGLAILQSRSTVLAIGTICAIYFFLSLFLSRSWFAGFLKLGVFCALFGFILYNILPILQIAIGQGIFRRNVFNRFELYGYALTIIPQAPFMGKGVDAALTFGLTEEIHNTFLSMAVKSGIPAAILSVTTVFAPFILFARSKKMAIFSFTLCFAMFLEHSFYPGRFNEYQIFAFMIIKLAWQNDLAERRQKALAAA